MKHGQKLLVVALVTVVLAVALALLAAGGESALAQPAIIFVDSDAQGAKSGSSWHNAFTDLQDALDEAEPLNQIWVAAGTYTPSHEFIPGNPRSASFHMVNGVAIYGGFEPGEGVTEFEDRDWVAYKTITSGNIGDEDRSGDNSYHVWYNPLDISLDGSAILDGFTITAGNANLVYYPKGLCGGGMLNDGPSPMLANVTFVGNSAGYGGGLWVSAPVPEEMTVVLTNVTFAGNSAIDGGAVYVNRTPEMMAEPLTFANCVFRGNVAERGGGVFITDGELDADTPQLRLTNCTFYGNEAETGGGIYVGKGPGEGWLAVTNSILWEDTPDEIYVEEEGDLPLVTYSDVQNGYDGEGNIDEDPRFVEPDSGDLHLQLDSPCIDFGDSGGPSLPPFDFDGDPRILDGDGDGWAVVDIGADEFKVSTIRVEIDITPDTPNNIIKLSSPRLVPVAILTTEEFNAVAEVAADTVLFAGAPHAGFGVADVDGDDDLDLIFFFYPAEMAELTLNSKEATLTGVTHDKTDFEGTDRVKVKE